MDVFATDNSFFSSSTDNAFVSCSFFFGHLTDFVTGLSFTALYSFASENIAAIVTLVFAIVEPAPKKTFKFGEVDTPDKPNCTYTANKSISDLPDNTTAAIDGTSQLGNIATPDKIKKATN